MLARPIEHSDVHVQATWSGAVIADSRRTLVVEGNHYFPREDVVGGHLLPSQERTFCPWKGYAGYYDVVVGDERNPAAAWYYADPMKAARAIRDHIAFWRGVEVRRLA